MKKWKGCKWHGLSSTTLEGTPVTSACWFLRLLCPSTAPHTLGLHTSALLALLPSLDLWPHSDPFVCLWSWLQHLSRPSLVSRCWAQGESSILTWSLGLALLDSGPEREKRKWEVIHSSWAQQWRGPAKECFSEKGFKRDWVGVEVVAGVCVCVCWFRIKLLFLKRNTGGRYKVWGWFKIINNPQTISPWLSEVITPSKGRYPDFSPWQGKHTYFG